MNWRNVGRLHIEISAHEALRLVELLGVLVEESSHLLETSWERAYRDSPTAQELSDIVSSSYTNRVNHLSLNQIDLLYQVFTGKGPILELPEALLFIGPYGNPVWSPSAYTSRNLPISRLREEGVDVLDKKALSDRLKQLAEDFEAARLCV